MKHIAPILLLLACTGIAHVQVHAQAPVAFDNTLAALVGADERGMRMYTLVLLTPGPRTDIPKAERNSLFRGHMANSGRVLGIVKWSDMPATFGQSLPHSRTESKHEGLRHDPCNFNRRTTKNHNTCYAG